MPVPSSSGTLALPFWRVVRKVLGPRIFSFLMSLKERRQFNSRFGELSLAGLRVPTTDRRGSLGELELPEPTAETLQLVVEVWKRLNIDKLEVGYQETYASIVDALLLEKPSSLSVLEVGVFEGASLRGWRSIFPDSRVFGLDIDESTMFSAPGIRTYVADQLSVKSLERATEGLPQAFDLIVDDGWHQPQANINSLVVLLKKLNPGGFFVVEDVHRRDYLPFWSRVVEGLPADFAGTVRPCGTHGISAHSYLFRNSLVIFRRL